MKLKLVDYYLKLERYFAKCCGFSKKKIEYDVAIIRLDAIGDYILFRNFLYELKSSVKYKHKTLLLIGNIEWKVIVEELDKEIFAECIWINVKEIWVNKLYRFKIFNFLSQYKFKDLINPTYSRDLLCSDAISNIINADNKIAFDGDCSNIILEYKKISDKFYTCLIPSICYPQFEFNRNKEFFESLLSNSLETKFFMPTFKFKQEYELPAKYVVLFIGASVLYKRWDIKKFIQLGEWLHFEYGLDVIFCGTQQDINGRDLYFNNNYLHNLVGKTSIVDLFGILCKAEFIVSNDTMVAHAGVAFNKHVFVIAINIGNNIKRFTTYPTAITSKYKAIYPPILYKDLEKHITGKTSQTFDINEISIDLVKNVISEHYIK